MVAGQAGILQQKSILNAATLSDASVLLQVQRLLRDATFGDGQDLYAVALQDHMAVRCSAIK